MIWHAEYSTRGAGYGSHHRTLLGAAFWVLGQLIRYGKFIETVEITWSRKP